MAEKDSWRGANTLLLLLVIITILIALPASAGNTLNPDALNEPGTLPSSENPIGIHYRKALKAYQLTKKPTLTIILLEKMAKVGELVGKDPADVSLTKAQYSAVLNDYAHFLYLAGQGSKALPILNRVIEVNPEWTPAYLNRENIYKDVYDRTGLERYKELYLKDHKTYIEGIEAFKKSYTIPFPEEVKVELDGPALEKQKEEEKERLALGQKMLKAAESNNMQEVVRLVEAGADPDSGAYDPEKDDWYLTGDIHNTALHFAALNNNLEMLKYLMTNGASISSNRGGLTPLFFAAGSGDIEMVRYLIEHGEDFDNMTRPHRGYVRVLYFAASSDKNGYDVFKYLFDLYNGDFKRLMGGGEDGDDTIQRIITDAAAIDNHEKAYMVLITIYDMVETVKKSEELRAELGAALYGCNEAFNEAVENAMRSGNQKLAVFLRDKGFIADMKKAVSARISGLIQRKKFDEAIKVINLAEEIGGEVFSAISLIPVYKTDRKCYRGEERYEGNEVEELLLPAIKAYNLNKHTESNTHNLIFSRFLDQLSSYSFKYPLCFDKARTIKVVRLMLENGLNPAFLNSEFHYIVKLNDLELAQEVLEKISVDEKIYYYLFAQARSMEMVMFLESHGFSLSNEEYKRLVEQMEKKTFSDTDRSVIEHYKTKIN